MTESGLTAVGVLSATQMEALEPVCDRFEAAWQAGRRPPIEDYLGDVPASGRSALLRELLELELHYRRRVGERPTAEEYRPRFPQDAAALQAAFAAPHPIPCRPTPSPEAEETGVDHNLLFGGLALQIGLIAREQLIAATGAWALDKRKPLAQVLVEQGALPAAHRALLEPLARAHLQRHGGDPQMSLATLGSLGTVYEELAATGDLAVQASLARVAAARPADDVPAGAAGASTSSGTRFRILRPHARGGLGEVYLARDEELHREVALKQIRREHADDPDSRARFLLEAEVTGRLEHPGIIPVYGLGHYADGRPFYAMRLIQGDSLKDAIARFHRDDGPDRDPGERALAFRELLGRFVDVCHALAYAHSRGVLHRDLKPANILLGSFGETLLVDWGLAKLVARPETKDAEGEAMLRPGSASGSPPTLVGEALGTPAYMSPEQAAGAPDRLGPASDVYSLGATLYDLLTGKAPFEGRDALEVLRRVQRESFPPPRAAHRAVPAALEAICLKAMALRPDDRYPSARALAEDVKRWLGDEPVAAYREPAAARAARWGRRHRPLVAGAATLTLTAAAGLAVGAALLAGANARTEQQRDMARRAAARAEADRDKATAINRFLTEDVLGQASPERNRRADAVTVEQALDRAAATIGAAFARQPEVEAAVRQTLGSTYRALGDYPKAEAHARRAYEIRLWALGPDHPDTLSALNDVGLVLGDRGRLAEAEPLTRRALAGLRRARGPDHPETLTALNNLAALLQARGRLAEAEPLLRQAWEMKRRTSGPGHPTTLTTLSNLALLLRDRGELVEAEGLCRRALEGRRRALGPDHPDTLDALNNLASLLQGRGKLAEAEPLYRRALEGRRRALGPDHPDTLNALSNLAALLRDRGRLAEAEPLYLRALEGKRRVLGPEHPETIVTLNNLAVLRYTQGKLAEAEPLLRRVLEGRRRALGPDHPATLIALNNLASLLQERGRLAEAEPPLRRALEGARRALGREHPTTLTFLHNVGGLLQDEGKLAEAEPPLREALEGRRRALGPDHPDTLLTTNLLATLLRDRGRLGEAEQLFRRALGGLRTALPDRHLYTASALAHLGDLLTATGRAEGAEPLLREALAICRATLPAGHRLTVKVQVRLGDCLTALGRYAEAEPLLLAGAMALTPDRGVPPAEARGAVDRVIRHYTACGRPAEAAAWRLRRLDLAMPADPLAP